VYSSYVLVAPSKQAEDSHLHAPTQVVTYISPHQTLSRSGSTTRLLSIPNKSVSRVFARIVSLTWMLPLRRTSMSKASLAVSRLEWKIFQERIDGSGLEPSDLPIVPPSSFMDDL
jgi:hypothetical protein